MTSQATTASDRWARLDSSHPLEKFRLRWWDCDKPLDIGSSIQIVDIDDPTAISSVFKYTDGQMYIRAEYDRMYSRLLENHKTDPMGASVLTGQPGIGKTTFCYYGLMRQFKSKKEVLFYTPGKYEMIRFSTDGTFQCMDLTRDLGGATPFGAYKGFKTICFIDYEAVVQDTGGAWPLPESVLGAKIYIFTAMSPNQRRWKIIAKVRKIVRFILNPWIREELNQAIAIHTFRTTDPAVCVARRQECAANLDSLIKTFGPVPRSIFNWQHSLLKRDIQQAVEGLSADQLTAMVAELWRPAFRSDKIILIQRTAENPGSDDFKVELLSPYVTGLVLDQLRHLHSTQVLQLIRTFGARPESNSSASWLWEGWSNTVLTMNFTEDEWRPVPELVEMLPKTARSYTFTAQIDNTLPNTDGEATVLEDDQVGSGDEAESQVGGDDDEGAAQHGCGQKFPLGQRSGCYLPFVRMKATYYSSDQAPLNEKLQYNRPCYAIPEKRENPLFDALLFSHDFAESSISFDVPEPPSKKQKLDEKPTHLYILQMTLSTKHGGSEEAIPILEALAEKHSLKLVYVLVVPRRPAIKTNYEWKMPKGFSKVRGKVYVQQVNANMWRRH